MTGRTVDDIAAEIRPAVFACLSAGRLAGAVDILEAYGPAAGAALPTPAEDQPYADSPPTAILRALPAVAAALEGTVIESRAGQADRLRQAAEATRRMVIDTGGGLQPSELPPVRGTRSVRLIMAKRRPR